jgi:hypothetical protein
MASAAAVEVAGAGEGGIFLGREREQMDTQSLDGFEQLDELLGFAAGGNGQQHIVGGQHAQVTVQSFDSVQEKGRRSGAGKGGGSLAADEPRFSQTGDDHAAFAGVEKLDGFFEAIVEALDQSGDCFRLNSQDTLGCRQGLARGSWRARTLRAASGISLFVVGRGHCLPRGASHSRASAARRVIFSTSGRN